MRFLRRHQFFLVFAGVLVLCSVLVVRQYMADQSAHVDLREDLILLDDGGHPRGAERLYQLLIQQLPGLPDRALIADEQRLAFLFLQKKPSEEDLVWKYYVSVQNELRQRNDRRIARALRRARSD